MKQQGINMNKLLSVFFILFATFVAPAFAQESQSIHENHTYHFLITKGVYQFSELYTITSPSKQTYSGMVKKSFFRIRTHYDLSDQHGWQATGIIRMMSVGTLYPWAVDIDVYDTRGKQIAMIDGSIATFESAKYDLYEYNEAGQANLIGAAYASGDFTRFVIFSASGNPHSLAELTRNFASQQWEVVVHHPELVDDRIIRLFAGFVIDYQDKFLPKAANDVDIDSLS